MLKKIGESKIGQAAAVIVIIAVGIFAYNQVRSLFGQSDAAAHANDRIFVCSETGKSFHVTLNASTQVPARSPYSGKNTGYPAELCYWTADGHVKSDPTPVLLNVYIGKSGPTFCPDCGRLVVGHNPRAQPGMNPPPTKAEYEARYAH
jgi:hypothetical protein